MQLLWKKVSNPSISCTESCDKMDTIESSSKHTSSSTQLLSELVKESAELKTSASEFSSDEVTLELKDLSDVESSYSTSSASYTSVLKNHVQSYPRHL